MIFIVTTLRNLSPELGKVPNRKETFEVNFFLKCRALLYLTTGMFKFFLQNLHSDWFLGINYWLFEFNDF